MKLIAGVLLLLGAEQAYAHAHLISFPKDDIAASVLIPASAVFLILGMILTLWGLAAEARPRGVPPS